MEAQLDTVLNSLSPPQRGEGWGEGILFFRNIDLLTPALSSFWEEEGENNTVSSCVHTDKKAAGDVLVSERGIYAASAFTSDQGHEAG